MTWFQIALIIYFGINLIIAVIITIVFKGLGYYDDWDAGKTYWGKAILIFIMLMIIGLPLAIFGLIEWLLDR